MGRHGLMIAEAGYPLMIDLVALRVQLLFEAPYRNFNLCS